MKVTHFHFGKDGGAERFYVNLVNALAKRNVEQISVIRPNRGWKPLIQNATKIIESHFRNFSLDKILLPIRVKKLANEFEPDAMMAWMPKGAKLMPNYTKAIRVARLGDYPTKLNHFKNIDVLVCNTPGIAKHVKEMGWTRGVEVISNFTSTKKAKPADRTKYDTPKNAFVISSMGRFVPRKGFDVLIKALKDVPNAYLWILGDGEEEENLKTLANACGVEERIRWIGWQSDPTLFVAASDVFAMASSHEPLGNVVLEAWAQDVAVVSTKSEGPTWFMKDGVNGLLVDIGDANGFAKAFLKVQKSKTLSAKLIKGGSKTLKDMFSEEAICKQYMELFSRKK
ncbi:MAG: glycosyltransferase [Nitratireductor sp.]